MPDVPEVIPKLGISLGRGPVTVTFGTLEPDPAEIGPVVDDSLLIPPVMLGGKLLPVSTPDTVPEFPFMSRGPIVGKLPGATPSGRTTLLKSSSPGIVTRVGT